MKHKRTYIVAAALAAVVLALGVSPVKPGWNRSESLPLGLYLSYAHDPYVPLARGDIVCVAYDRPAWAVTNYLYPGELLCKQVMGVAGDILNSRADTTNEVCHDGKCDELGKPLEKDSVGHPMQHFTWKNEVIPAGMYYLGATRKPNSLDSRYLGLFKQESIVKTLRPVWTEQDK